MRIYPFGCKDNKFISKYTIKGIKYFDFVQIIPFRLYSQESSKRLCGLHCWQKAGLTIRGVADMTGLSKTIICNTESGHSNITIDSLNTLAAAYGLSVRIE